MGGRIKEKGMEIQQQSPVIEQPRVAIDGLVIDQTRLVREQPLQPEAIGPPLQKVQLPPRRSMRLQASSARRQTTQGRDKNKRNSAIRMRRNLPPTTQGNNVLPFSLQNQEKSLDVAQALALLQATGLEIDAKVMQQVETAFIDQPTTPPQTPLHDTVPPYQLRGKEPGMI
jgi:hypothetical protein